MTDAAKCLWPEDCKYPACVCRRTDSALAVPREPTGAMFIAGTKALAEAEGSFARHVWYAMYDAAIHDSAKG